MNHHRLTRLLGALTLAGLLALTAACGSSAPTTTHDKADVAFATDMLPHHAQALAMVELTTGRTLDAAVQQLASDIRDAQTPEIATMTGWLKDWKEKVPDTSGSMDDMGSMHDMPGMMSADEMASLSDASDAEFQTRWLELMVKHHEGAVQMAKAEIADGTYPPAIALAKSIVASQSKEIATMNAILG